MPAPGHQDHHPGGATRPADVPDGNARRFHYGWIVLAMGTLAVFGAIGLARFGYTMVLPAMQAGLGLDNTQAGGLATANLAGYLLLSVIGGALAARHGTRTVVVLALVLTALGMGLTGQARGYGDAAVYRFLTGAGSGASNVPVMALMAAWFTQRRRGMAAGITAAGSSLALMLLGPLVPAILARFGASGWRICWFGFGGITLVLALGAYAFLRNTPAALGMQPLGAALDRAPPPPPGAALPWGRVYRSAAVWHLGLVYSAFGFSYIIYMTFFVKGLIAEGGYTPATAGTLFMIMGWLSLLCGLIWGTLSDIIGRRAALIIVFILHATAFTLFAVARTPLGFTASAIIYGLTAWSIPAIMAAACGDLLGPRMAPSALGFITLFMGIGQALGPWVAGLMADALSSFSPAFLLAAGVALAGALGAATLRAERKGESLQQLAAPHRLPHRYWDRL